jgi:hypothetical protein
MAEQSVRTLQGLVNAIRESPQCDTALRMTLVLLLLHGPPGQGVALRLLCAAMLGIPVLVRSPHAWVCVTGFIAYANWRDRYTIDNHQYLIMYWAAVVTLAVTLVAEDRRMRFLRVNAIALTAVVFLFAALWKVIGGEYFDGSFMHYTFLTDGRFRTLAAWISGRDAVDIAAGADAVMYLGSVGAIGAQLSLATAPSLKLATLVMSWAGVAVEGTIGVLHSMPSRALYALRLTLFWVFVAVTYFLFPVLGFAFILTILGYAQCDETDRRRQMAFLALFVLIHFTLLPWQQLLARG